MKKIFFILLTVMLTLTACNKTSDVENKTKETVKKLKIITTIFPQYDFTREIVKDKADVQMLLKPGAEAHSYEPSPQDIKDIEESDILIYVGGENDVWVEKVLASLNKKPSTFKLIDMVETVDEVIKEGMEDSHDHSHEDEIHKHDEEKHDDHNHEHEAHTHEGEIDEHVWTSLKNAALITERLAKIYGAQDVENADFYNQNAQSYIEKLNALDQKFMEVVKNGNRKTILFGDRYPFRYFSDDYDLDYYAAFSGCSTDSEASAATIKFLIDKVNEEKIPVVFALELSNEKIADAITDATDAVKLTFNSAHNLTKQQLEAGLTYLQIMEQNVESLKEALK